ncbi:MAG: DUF1439 domain-containing protein [Methylotenera sp.]|nr:DUF1439 domain-containing protein [Methylotenera sp.]
MTRTYDLVLLLASLLFACVSLPERSYRISERQVQQKINERFLAPIPLLKVFQVNLADPVVKFDAKTGRMKTRFNVKLSHTPSGKSYTGKVLVSGELQFDALANAIVLNEVEVDQLSLDGKESNYMEFASVAAQSLAAEKLNGVSLYAFKPQDLKFGADFYQVKGMQITDSGLQITFSRLNQP